MKLCSCSTGVSTVALFCGRHTNTGFVVPLVAVITGHRISSTCFGTNCTWNFGCLGPEVDSRRRRLLLVNDQSCSLKGSGACLKQSFLRMDEWGMTISDIVCIPKSLVPEQ